MMIFANLEENGEQTAYLFDGWDEFDTATFSPDITPKDIIPLVIHGRTYRERQNSLRELAIDIQRADDGGLPWSKYSKLDWFFRENGRRYGLMTEFRENCIC